MIAHYVRNGAVINLLVVSDGAAIEEPDGQHDDIVTERFRELEAATTILGIQHLHALQLPDGQLASYTAQIHEEIKKYLTTFHPDLVLAPSPIDWHPDHVTVGRITLQLFRSIPGWRLAFYEVLAPLHFNTLVDITDVASIKEKAIRCYQRSLFQQPHLFWEAFRALNLFKSAFVHRHGYFEALWVLQAPLTDAEVVAWATYEFALPPNPNVPLTLQFVQEIDQLIFALKEKNLEATNFHQETVTLQREKAELQRQLDEQREIISALQQAAAERSREGQYIQTNAWTRTRHFLQQRLDRAFPDGSNGRQKLRILKRFVEARQGKR